MAKTDITAQYVRELFDYDADGGFLVWKPPRGGRFRNQGRAGGIERRSGITRINIDGRFYLAHRVIWLWHHGVWPTCDIDHKLGRAAGNHIENLRDVTRTINAQNLRGPHRDNSSGHLGVTWFAERHKWRVQLSVNGKNKWFGDYTDLEEAAAASIEARRKFHDGCTI